MKKIMRLIDSREWEQLKKVNEDAELIIFKYSPICSISASVENDFDEWFARIADEQSVECAKVNVIESRPLSRQIADELSINHQSPQVIWLNKGGGVKWSASHYDINASSLEAHRSK